MKKIKEGFFIPNRSSNLNLAEKGSEDPDNQANMESKIDNHQGGKEQAPEIKKSYSRPATNNLGLGNSSFPLEVHDVKKSLSKPTEQCNQITKMDSESNNLAPTLPEEKKEMQTIQENLDKTIEKHCNVIRKVSEKNSCNFNLFDIIENPSIFGIYLISRLIEESIPLEKPLNYNIVIPRCTFINNLHHWRTHKQRREIINIPYKTTTRKEEKSLILNIK